ncbi:hypothetical protein DMENIID0001_148430 [Sergentomyia squamirostris]
MSSTLDESGNKVWSGPEQGPFYHETVSIGRALYYTMSRDHGLIAQINDNNGITMTNVPVHVIDTSYTVEEFQYMLSKTKPCIIFLTSTVYERIRKATEGIDLKCTVVTIDQKLPGVEHIEDYLVGTREKWSKMGLIDKDTIAIICHTSGTTGLPKTVSLSHQHLLFKFGYPNAQRYPRGLRSIAFNSIYWFTGILVYITTTLIESTRIITTDTFSPELLFGMVEKYKPSLFFSCPYELIAMLSSEQFIPDRMSSVTEYSVSGSILLEATWDAIRKFFPTADLYNVYGMSETGAIAVNSKTCTKYSAGKILPGVQLKFLNKEFADGSIGEICIKSEFLFLGYYGDPEATATVVDSEGWVHTGDIGMIDEDGDLHVIDRVKDVIDFCSENVLPLQIEQVLLTYSAVKLVSVVGIPHPHYGEVAAAAVVLKSGNFVTEEEIKEHVASKLSYYKHLRGGVHFFEDLPRTSTAKIKKRVIKEIISNIVKF